MISTYLQQVIGAAPLGFSFLEYIFSFVLCCFALFIVYKVAEAICQLF